MNWKIATLLVAAAMGLLLASMAGEAFGAGPKPPWRCNPKAYVKCWYGPSAPNPPVVVRPTLPEVPKR